VGGNDQRGAAALRAVLQQREGVAGRCVVQAGCGLIGQEDLRGCNSTARASATRWAWPPESVDGRRAASAATPRPAGPGADGLPVQRQAGGVIDQLQVTGDRERLAQVQLLGQEADVPRTPGIRPGGAQPRQRLAGDE
jgi:hypothetical protein